jgi:hypothetical protein
VLTRSRQRRSKLCFRATGKKGPAEVLELLDGSERDFGERLDRGAIDRRSTVIRPHHARYRPSSGRGALSHGAAAGSIRWPVPIWSGPRTWPATAWSYARHCEALPEINPLFTARGVRPRFVLKTTSDHRVLAVGRGRPGHRHDA